MGRPLARASLTGCANSEPDLSVTVLIITIILHINRRRRIVRRAYMQISASIGEEKEKFFQKVCAAELESVNKRRRLIMSNWILVADDKATNSNLIGDHQLLFCLISKKKSVSALGRRKIRQRREDLDKLAVVLIIIFLLSPSLSHSNSHSV